MKHWILAMMVGVWAAGVAGAAHEKNDQEHDLLFGYGCTEYDDDVVGGHSSDYAFQYGGGYFFTQWLSAGLRLGGQYINNVYTPESALNVGPYVKIHFLADTDLVPYVGMQGGFWWQDTHYPRGNHENMGAMWGPLAGAKFYLDEGTYLVAEYQWRMFCCDIGRVAEHASVGLVGIGFTF